MDGYLLRHAVAPVLGSPQHPPRDHAAALLERLHVSCHVTRVGRALRMRDVAVKRNRHELGRNFGRDERVVSVQSPRPERCYFI